MANKVIVLAILSVAVATVLLAESPAQTEAVVCIPIQLAVCADAIMNNKPPTKECCDNLKQQESCLCDYKKNPAFRQYVDSPGAKKTASTCGVTIAC